MIVPLDPGQLTPAASINRLQIVDLPGVWLEEWIKGKNAYDLISSQALNREILQAAELLHIDPSTETSQLPVLFDRCLTVEDATIRGTADDITQRYGHALGYVLLTLKRGDPVNRAVRTDWDESYWDYWGHIQQVWLGGGLMRGQLGSRAVEIAQKVIAGAGVEDFKVNRSPYTNVSLPLLGVARYAPPAARCIVVVDCGSTFIKSGSAVYEKGALTHITDQQAVPSNCNWVYEHPDRSDEFVEYVVTTIANAWRRSVPCEPFLAVSLSCYVQDGQVAERGYYSVLRKFTDHAESYLAGRVSDILGLPVQLKLFHDGTAAAAVFAGSDQTAVLTLGTAVGVGFPPPIDVLRPLKLRQ